MKKIISGKSKVIITSEVKSDSVSPFCSVDLRHTSLRVIVGNNWKVSSAVEYRVNDILLKGEHQCGNLPFAAFGSCEWSSNQPSYQWL